MTSLLLRVKASHYSVVHVLDYFKVIPVQDNHLIKFDVFTLEFDKDK